MFKSHESYKNQTIYLYDFPETSFFLVQIDISTGQRWNPSSKTTEVSSSLICFWPQRYVESVTCPWVGRRCWGWWTPVWRHTTPIASYIGPWNGKVRFLETCSHYDVVNFSFWWKEVGETGCIGMIDNHDAVPNLWHSGCWIHLCYLLQLNPSLSRSMKSTCAGEKAPWLLDGDDSFVKTSCIIFHLET